MIAQYVKKPVIIDAFQWTGANGKDLMEFCPDCYVDDSVGILMINTLEGPMRGSVDDFIIKGISGEFYACKPQIFYKSYEKVN